VYNPNPIFDPYAEAVERVIQQAERVLPPQPDGVVLLRGDQVQPEPINWLWHGWLARGKLNLLAGQPAAGKTTLALELAARVTRGDPWPDGSRGGPPRDVVIWSAEDAINDTLLPRLMAAGADRYRCHFLDGIRRGGEMIGFDPAKDVPAFARACAAVPDLGFALIDPISVAVAGDSYKNTEVRRGLQPLLDFAAETDAALLGISHLQKATMPGSDPLSWILGSGAFGALARSVLFAANVRQPEGGSRRVFCRVKATCSESDGGFEYTLEKAEPEPGIHTSKVAFGERLEGSAAELLTPAAPERGARESIPGQPKASERAEQFLRERLALGTCPSNVLKAEAEAAGIKWKHVEAAAIRLGVLKQKGGYQGHWYWTLRTPPGTTREAAPEPQAEPETAESAGQVKESPEITIQNEQDSLVSLARMDSLDDAETETEALLGPAPPPSSFVREPAKPNMRPHRKLFEAAWHADGSPEQDGLPHLTEDALRRYAATTGYPWQTCANAVEGLVEAGYAEPHLAGWLITDRGTASMMPRMMA